VDVIQKMKKFKLLEELISIYGEEFSDEEKKNMCQLQFELMNHIANSLLELQRKQNVLTQLILKKDETGSKLLKDFMKKKEDSDKKDKNSYDIYQ
ncbi:hypothetical protein LCGC14_1117870, partial [marine sediment metagenome]